MEDEGVLGVGYVWGRREGGFFWRGAWSGMDERSCTWWVCPLLHNPFLKFQFERDDELR